MNIKKEIKDEFYMLLANLANRKGRNQHIVKDIEEFINLNKHELGFYAIQDMVIDVMKDFINSFPNLTIVILKKTLPIKAMIDVIDFAKSVYIDSLDFVVNYKVKYDLQVSDNRLPLKLNKVEKDIVFSNVKDFGIKKFNHKLYIEEINSIEQLVLESVDPNVKTIDSVYQVHVSFSKDGKYSAKIKLVGIEYNK